MHGLSSNGFIHQYSHDRVLERFRRERARVLKSAILRYRSGECWWLNQAEQALSEKLNTYYEHQDAWLEAIERYLQSHDLVTITEVLGNCIQQDLEKHSRRDQMRVSEILKSLGWSKQRRRIDGTRAYFWARSQQDQSSTLDSPTSQTDLSQNPEGWGRPEQDLKQHSVPLSHPSSQKTTLNLEASNERDHNCHFETVNAAQNVANSDDTDVQKEVAATNSQSLLQIKGRSCVREVRPNTFREGERVASGQYGSIRYGTVGKFPGSGKVGITWDDGTRERVSVTVLRRIRR